jgi:hypothetical protein
MMLNNWQVLLAVTCEREFIGDKLEIPGVQPLSGQ